MRKTNNTAQNQEHVTNRRLITIIVLLTTFISMMSQTMMVTALPLIGNVMHEPLTTVQWLTTGYTLMIGIITPLTSNLYEKYSSRKIFLSLLIIFALGTGIAAISTNFWMLLLGRLLQAASGGFLMTFQMTTMMTIYPPAIRGTVMGLSTFVIAFGPAVGPTIAGFIVTNFDWRYLFISILPIIIIIFFISLWKFPNYSNTKPVKIDLISVIESFLAVTLIMLSITITTTHLSVGIAMLVIGLLIGGSFIYRQLHMKKPLLDIRILQQSSFLRMTVISIFAYIILVGLGQIFSIYAQVRLAATSLTTGLILLPGAILNAFSSIAVGKMYDNHGPKKLIFFGSLLMFVSFALFFIPGLEITLGMLSIVYTIILLGIGFVFSPSLTEAFSDIPASQISQATALNNTLRQIFASIMITIMIIVMTAPVSMAVGLKWTMLIGAVLSLFISISIIKFKSQP